MINKDIPRLHKLQKALSLTNVNEEIDMAIKLRSFFNEDKLINDPHKEYLHDYYFKEAYDLLVAHIVDVINIDDE